MRFSLTLLAIMLVIATALLSPAQAGGTKHHWQIANAPTKAVPVLVVVDQNMVADTSKSLSKESQKALMVYLGVTKLDEIKNRHFDGNNLDETISEITKWAVHITPRQKQIEVISRGILTLGTFAVPKEMILTKKDFHGLYLDKDTAGQIGERVSVLSDFKCEIGEAQASDFNVLPKEEVYTTMSVIENTMTLQSGGPGFVPVNARSAKVYRFAIVPDSIVVVQFDLTQEQLAGEKPLCPITVYTSEMIRKMFDPKLP